MNICPKYEQEISIVNSDFFCNSDITIILVEQTWHGKSATGNSILGRKAVLSELPPGSVTSEW
ncbi:hypothetical protein DPMN_169652 [Dreissena polymorpha]|uniref:AIG1-type G domain-containing protein n=1 Tax=Dreissena polymorpha TaxID=45954 RepID=A0A9D4IC70_DREPO|nr:hypothetical protein DPMN_169652 [Dreissena polymorpha]